MTLRFIRDKIQSWLWFNRKKERGSPLDKEKEKYSLKELRARKKLTQKEAAEEIGITENTWVNWESGKTYPNVISIGLLEDLFEVSFAEMKFLP
ncbi:helix-turn-helix transcriptional regulator [Lactococcus lactis subsp. lactis]|nr:helix-turn-helix transcriptional regulator [Lactococcus lactis subsp. lactis]